MPKPQGALPEAPHITPHIRYSSTPQNSWVKNVSRSQRGNLSLREAEVNVQDPTAAEGLIGIYTQVRLLLQSLSASHASEEQMAYFSVSPRLQAELDRGPLAV